MAQDTRKITIEIIGSASSGSEKNNYDILKSGGEQGNLNDKLRPMNSKTGKTDKSLFGKSVLINQAFQTAKSLLKNGIDMSINRYFMLTENYIAENNYRNIKAAVGKVASAASTVAAGFTMGGPIGAAVAAVGWTGNEVLTAVNKYANYQHSINTANYETNFAGTRASLYNNGRGTEN